MVYGENSVKPVVCGIRATALTPFCYHSLAVQGGTATLPTFISDRAVMFSLGAALGFMNCSVALPQKDYVTHLRALPWRASVFSLEGDPRLLPPLARRLNLDGEAGFRHKLRGVVDSGNLKDFFHTQEVPPEQQFIGALFGYDPFKAYKRTYFVVRVGLHRSGLLKLEPTMVEQVCLNVWTASVLFGREMSVARYVLHSLQLSPFMPVSTALDEVMQWN